MKVENIEELQSTTDGKPYWIISFEGKKMTFTDWDKPIYAEGDELPFGLELMKPAGKKWYWKKKETSRSVIKAESKPKTSYTASPEKIESIEYQNSRNIAAQIYCHVTEPGAPFDAEQLHKIFRACQSLGKDLIETAKKEYGAVEK